MSVLKGIGVDKLSYGSSGAAGFDIPCSESFSIQPGEIKLVKTGQKWAIEDGYEVQIRSRSGLSLKRGVIVLNAPGTIDSDYRGGVGIILMNVSNEVQEFNVGDRVAQGVLAKVSRAEFVSVESLGDTGRGDGGFGSTGVSK